MKLRDFLFYSPTADGGGTSGTAEDTAGNPLADDAGTGSGTTETPADDPAADDPKSKNREGYETRQAKKQLTELQQELEGYKRREEEARKSKLTQEQKLQEERDSLAARVEQLQAESLRNKIAAELKLPASLAARLIGSDEDSLRADAEELAKLLPKPKAGQGTNPLQESNGKRVYTRAELQKDPKLAASPEVRQAALEGRIQ